MGARQAERLSDGARAAEQRAPEWARQSSRAAGGWLGVRVGVDVDGWCGCGVRSAVVAWTHGGLPAATPAGGT